MASHQKKTTNHMRIKSVRADRRRLAIGILSALAATPWLGGQLYSQDYPNRYPQQPTYSQPQPQPQSQYPFVPGQYPSTPSNSYDAWSNQPQVAQPAPVAQAYGNQPYVVTPPSGSYTIQPGAGGTQSIGIGQSPGLTFGAPEQVQAAPYVASPNVLPSPMALGEPVPPLTAPWMIDTKDEENSGGLYQPRVRDVPIDVYLQEAQTGRFIMGGSVNTDLGVAGQFILEERNFDITKYPTSWSDLFNGAFRGDGQNFRLEAVPGSQVQRYSVDWTQPNLFGYSPFSLSVGGFLFDRIYRDYDEGRLGGRVMVGYVVTPDLQISSEIRGENVDISQPRVSGVPILDRSLGDNDVYTGRVRLTHNTRDSPFMPTEGHFFEAIYDQVFGEYDFPRAQLNYSRYFLIRERADQGGRHTLTVSHRLGFSGKDTPIFENFFAGGFTTLRGFRFRGAGPVENTVQVGGRMQFLGSVEYSMPITADDMLRVVSFVDYGIIERDIKWDWDNVRVAPGIGLRIKVPAMGPAPLAFDFAAPLNKSDGDLTQVFSFNMGLTR